MNNEKIVHNIYKNNLKKYENSKKAINKIHEELFSYYIKFKDPVDLEILLKRLAHLEFGMNYSKNILISILFGIITSFIVEGFEYLENIKIISNINSINSIKSFLYLILILLIIVLVTSVTLSIPACLGLFLSYKWVTNKFDILLLQYEKDLIIDILRLNYDINYVYQPKEKNKKKAK